MRRKLVKSSNDKVLFGVCSGIGEYFGWDSTLVRIAFLVAAVFGVGSFALLYIVLAIIMPK